MQTTIYSPTQEHIKLLADQLQANEVVAIPTETVYGLAGNARSAVALKKIFEIKNRPENHPLIVHFAKPDESTHQAWTEVLAEWSREIPEIAIQLAQAFWAGPLTLVLPKAKSVLKEVTGGQDSVGLRCPSHPVAQAILKEFGGGLAAPSANRFGKISPTTSLHVTQEFVNVRDENFLQHHLAVLDGGACHIGIESTIINLCDWSTTGPTLLRPGMISIAEIEEKTGIVVSEKIKSSLRHSGGLMAHYAPKTLLSLKKIDFKNFVAIPYHRLAYVYRNLDHVALEKDKFPMIDFYLLPESAEQIAHNLYSQLRELDTKSYDEIVFCPLPLVGQWHGIMDRLLRAEQGSGTANDPSHL